MMLTPAFVKVSRLVKGY